MRAWTIHSRGYCHLRDSISISECPGLIGGAYLLTVLNAEKYLPMNVSYTFHDQTRGTVPARVDLG